MKPGERIAELRKQPRGQRLALVGVFAVQAVIWSLQGFLNETTFLRWSAVVLAPLCLAAAGFYAWSLVKERAP